MTNNVLTTLLWCCHKRTLTVLASHGSRLSAVSAWNDLPAHIRDVSTISSFKHNLKTLLFTAAFAN